jgi:type II secretory pathway pseudopilin PulG
MWKLTRDAHGSALIEAVIAAALLATVLTGIVPLVTTAVAGAAAARADLIAAHLARQRLAQLQTLTYATFPSGVIADGNSRLDDRNVFTIGGTGLQPTGLAPLQGPTPPWADWLDGHGAWLASGTQAPPGARFHRRWGILFVGGEGCLRLWVEASWLGPSVGDRVFRVASLQCPWGAETP